MICDIKVNDLYCVLVHKVRGKETFDTTGLEIIKYNIYNGHKVQHILCKVNNIPHIKYILDDKKLYQQYMKNSGKFAGFGLEHSFETFDNLINTFDEYLKEPYQNKYITCKKMFNKFVITDGLHRASLLLTKNVDTIKVFLK